MGAARLGKHILRADHLADTIQLITVLGCAIGIGCSLTLEPYAALAVRSAHIPP